MKAEPIITDPIDVRRRLTELGLSVEVLNKAILTGHVFWKSCTPNDPPAIPGVSFWGRVVRTLREELVEDGWVRSDKGGFSVVVSPDKTFAIAVSTGDEATGNPDETASTKYPKGPKTVQAVRRNNGTLFLFHELEPTPDEEAEATRQTRFLLIKRDIGAIHAELSLPKDVENGFVVSWSERIILPEIDLDEFERAEPEGGIGDDDLDINVTRRSAS
jgi:hypothetical protein